MVVRIHRFTALFGRKVKHPLIHRFLRNARAMLLISAVADVVVASTSLGNYATETQWGSVDSSVVRAPDS